ncbi:MAG: hypothetical protein IH801_08285 [Nitrospinae bacterium]|nr:hypothetical protein [Nitrospinota bacterium]
MSYLKEKWQANIDKVAFAKAFPGRQTEWQASVGKTVEAVIPVPTDEETVVLSFTDGDFIIAPKLKDTPKEILIALKEAKPALERFHAEAYKKLEELVVRDRELTRNARMERIVDAVRNNMDKMPDLKASLLKLFKEADEA